MWEKTLIYARNLLQHNPSALIAHAHTLEYRYLVCDCMLTMTVRLNFIVKVLSLLRRSA